MRNRARWPSWKATTKSLCNSHCTCVKFLVLCVSCSIVLDPLVIIFMRCEWMTEKNSPSLPPPPPLPSQILYPQCRHVCMVHVNLPPKIGDDFCLIFFSLTIARCYFEHGALQCGIGKESLHQECIAIKPLRRGWQDISYGQNSSHRLYLPYTLIIIFMLTAVCTDFAKSKVAVAVHV